MAPYFCYIHQGLYDVGPDDGRCHDPQCLEFAKKDVRPAGIHVAGFAGSQFHKDMYAYKDAVDQGVNPDQVTAVAAEASLKQAEATEHGSN